ncbi:MAG TPA: hypothetical protein PLD20_30975 [Blastocatellia bacterium]|nr:hypothetical protein [Blastocatellia bacterium]HMX28538.1 hypothetical protein [Blastocatellia bacterium]HMY72518.1 hypothetical protein [Blastocatellia bacterium]HMZ22395.1 hypothetical protein [Blastocatellia bacterium]HNG34447.1 hypothetical protein [Blastocatellia bacterium]
MSNKKKVAFAILALILVSIVREKGYINWQVTRSKFQKQLHLNLTTTYYEDDDGKWQLMRQQNSGDEKENSNYTSWDLGLNLSPRGLPRIDSFTDFEAQLIKELKEESKIQVNIEKVSLSGLYWVPLFKVGLCEYSFSIEAVGRDSKVYRGKAQGEVSFSIYGLSSVTEAKKTTSQNIAKLVIASVKKVLPI